MLISLSGVIWLRCPGSVDRSDRKSYARESSLREAIYPVHGPCVAALAAPGFHRADSLRQAGFGLHFILGQSRLACASRLTQTLGVTKNMSVNLMHHAAFKPSRPTVRCLSASALRCARAMPTLRSKPERLPFVAVAKAAGNSDVPTVYALCNQRSHSSPIQSASALARRRGQMLVSQWALPLSEGRRGLQAAVPRGSGVGGVQAVPRLSTVVTPNPSIKRTVKGLRPSPAAYVKR